MNTVAPEYRKIRGGGFSWKGHGGLWLAEDHLLEVTSIYVLENYRRFFFQDIRAFAMQRTNVRSLWGWILGSVGAVSALIAAATFWVGVTNSSKDWHVAWYVPAFMFGAAALFLLTICVINLALGPTCRCHVLTSTGWHALSAPTRIGKASRVQAQIVSIIETVQGAVPPAGGGTP